ncbi:MmcQ/YjbR family DNA-binding protein [Paenibacillus sp. GCM10027626]|uniref:MmcQ/YjbR family DNA-binding protein n=1 Tax=Paenibacillus sp. GCM10027626 TaxID=3273411 RepID=UPI003629BF53
MQQQQLEKYGLTKPGAWEDYPFGPEPLVLKTGSKMFALLTEESVSLKCDPVIAESLREQHKAITPGYHLNKKHWNSIALDGSLSLEELQAMMDHSYELVFRSLTKAEREKISEAK